MGQIIDKGLLNVTVMKKNVKNCRAWDVDVLVAWEE